MSNRLAPAIALLTLLASVAAAQTRAEPAEGRPLVPAGVNAFAITGNGASKAGASIVPVVGQPFDKAWRVQLREKVRAEYDVQLAATLAELPKKGDVVWMTAYARLIDTVDESGQGQIGLVLEQNVDPYDKVFNATFGVTRQWQRFDVPAVVDRDLATTGAHVTINVGAYVQTVEVGGIALRVMPAGTDVKTLPRTTVDYVGRKPDAPWRGAAAERIEKLRKADLSITVVDAAGKSVPDASVAVRMKKHAFVFGSCYAPRTIVDAGAADAKKYRETFLANFNAGVDEYAMKWPGWVEPETRQLALDALAWMRDHGIAVRGHTMVWPAWKRLPPAVKNDANDKDALREQIAEHIASVGAAMRGKVIDWDVVNEPFANHDLMDVLGEGALADWFKLARAADPTATLYLNETSVPTSPPSDERYAALYDRAKRLKDAGAPIGGVGMQAHFGQNVQPPTQLLAIYDRFEKLGLPVRITELDIDIADEQLQADYYRDFLTASFSHPNLNGILIWGFWEGAHWRPLAAMYRRDWSPRPIAGVWRDLVYKQWWTSVDGKTDAAGTFATRGFLGDYEVTVTRGAASATTTFSLGAGGAKPRVALGN